MTTRCFARDITVATDLLGSTKVVLFIRFVVCCAYGSAKLKGTKSSWMAFFYSSNITSYDKYHMILFISFLRPITPIHGTNWYTQICRIKGVVFCPKSNSIRPNLSAYVCCCSWIRANIQITNMFALNQNNNTSTQKFKLFEWSRTAYATRICDFKLIWILLFIRILRNNWNKPHNR